MVFLGLKILTCSYISKFQFFSEDRRRTDNRHKQWTDKPSLWCTHLGVNSLHYCEI